MLYASLAQLIQLSRPAPHKATISELHSVSLSLCLSSAGSHTLISFSQSLSVSLSLSQGLLSHALLLVLYNVFVAVMKRGEVLCFIQSGAKLITK